MQQQFLPISSGKARQRCCDLQQGTSSGSNSRPVGLHDVSEAPSRLDGHQRGRASAALHGRWARLGGKAAVEDRRRGCGKTKTRRSGHALRGRRLSPQLQRGLQFYLVAQQQGDGETPRTPSTRHHDSTKRGSKLLDSKQLLGGVTRRRQHKLSKTPKGTAR